MRAGFIASFVTTLTFSGAVFAQSGAKLVIVENFAPKAGFALETDDAQVLSKAGCLEALTRIDFDGRLQPSLASEWKQVAPDSWEFTLRPDVKFQNGQPLTAHAVADALNLALKAPAPSRGFSPRVIKSVEAVSDKVVRIVTPAASNLTPFRLANPNTGILAPAAYKDGKIDPVGNCTGPFTLTYVNVQQNLLLKRNDAYWGEKAAVAQAEVRFIPDANVRATQLRTGEAQIARTLPATSLATLKKTNGLKVFSAPTPRTSGLLINNKKAPLDNAKVRQAIQAALDLNGIAASIYEGTVEPAIGPFAPAEPWAPKGAAPAALNVAKAKALLAEAGIRPGSLKLELFAYNEKGEFKDVAAIVQEQLKAIGIEASIRAADYAALEPDILAGRYDLALLSRSHLTDVADPAGYLASDYGCKGGYNLSHYCDPEYDARLEAAAAESDPAKRYVDLSANWPRSCRRRPVNAFLIHETGHDASSSEGPELPPASAGTLHADDADQARLTQGWPAGHAPAGEHRLGAGAADAAPCHRFRREFRHVAFRLPSTRRSWP